jgi:S1-C subfamily serine protease
MRKFLLAALLALTLVAVRPVAAQTVNISQDERAVTGTILVPNGSHLEMICSGVETGYDSDGNGIFVTARHCVFNDEVNAFYKNEVVSFSDNGSGPYYATELYQVSNTDDLAVLKLKGAGARPVAQIGDESQLKPGDPVDNVSYPEFMGKLEFHGAFITPVWPHVPRDILYAFPQWAHVMPVDITIAPGSSGSPLFDSKTHAVIGIMVGSTNQGRLNIAIPISRLLFMYLTKDGDIKRFVMNNPPKVYSPSIGDSQQ